MLEVVLLFFASIRREVVETVLFDRHERCSSAVEVQFDFTRSTISVFGNDDFLDVRTLFFWLECIITVDEHYQVGVLFDGTGIPKV